MVVCAGIIALAIAMGIGRFAFTPLLPLMLRDGTLTANGGAEWAAANYGGYLVGALTASRFASNPQRGSLIALAGVTLSTIAVTWLHPVLFGLGGAALRALAGLFSAWVLVCTSSWCLAELARRGAPYLGAWIYIGVGLGIALAGLLTWVGGPQPAQWLWLELGLLALAGTLVYARALHLVPTTVTTTISPTSDRTPRRNSALVICYGILGFGYIVPATYLPTMAREQVADPFVFGLTWPLFGIAAAASVAAAAKWLPAWHRQHVWSAAHTTMALGTALCFFTPALWSLSASAILVGGTFMVATMAGLQLARQQVPDNPTPLLANMTAAFAFGQIAGPLVVRAMGAQGWPIADAIAWTNGLATLLLGGSAIWLWRRIGTSRSTTPASPYGPGQDR